MDPIVVFAALSAALMHAGWNLAVKQEGDRFLTLTLMAVTSAVLVTPALPLLPWPSAPAWPYLVVSALLHAGYRAMLAEGYRHGHLSQVYPIARGAAPLIVCVLSYLFAGQTLSVGQLAGVLLIAFGIASLALRTGLPAGYERRAVGFALATATATASYTVVDGLGARLAGQALSYALWLFLLEGIAMLLWGLLRCPDDLASFAPQAWRKCMVSGAVMSSAHVLVIWALSVGDFTLVSALRETSVLFAALLAAIVLREPLGGWRGTATVVVFAGMVLLPS
jgi:drug/metabolite transporter (DMT)-like permease